MSHFLFCRTTYCTFFVQELFNKQGSQLHVLQDVAAELAVHPPVPVLPQDQLMLTAEMRAEKKKPAVKEKKNFSVKTHKRKTKDGHVSTFAIVETAVNKQIVQLRLSDHTCADALAKIEEMVDSLNQGSITKTDAVAAIDALKTKKH